MLILDFDAGRAEKERLRVVRHMVWQDYFASVRGRHGSNVPKFSEDSVA